MTEEQPFVIKNNKNAKHDGFICFNVLSKEEFDEYLTKDCIFQKLINNIVDSQGLTLHYRVPVLFFEQIPLVYEYVAKNEHRFAPINTKTVIKNVEDVFTLDEIENILTFCKEMCLEYCELDILRDNDNKRIYIIDANDTPCILYNGYPISELKRSIEIQALSFKQFIDDII